MTPTPVVFEWQAPRNKQVFHFGEPAPRPDYKLYLSREFVESEDGFVRLKSGMAVIGDVKTFKNFVVAVPQGVDVGSHNTVIIWCEAFSQFIAAAKYRWPCRNWGQIPITFS